MINEQKLPDDALVMVFLRNEFYKRKFHVVLGVYILSLIAIGFLCWVLFYLVKNPARPLYFVTDKVGRLLEDVPKNLPNMSNDDVAAWVTEAIEATYSYDFVNYRSQLQSAQKYFTDYGWRNYMHGLTSSNNLVALNQRKFVIIAKAVDKPKLLSVGMIGGAYAWKFEVPILADYLSPPFDAKSSFQNPILVTVVVQRQSILTSYKGLGILQTYGNLVTTPASPNLSAPPS